MHSLQCQRRRGRISSTTTTTTSPRGSCCCLIILLASLLLFECTTMTTTRSTTAATAFSFSTGAVSSSSSSAAVSSFAPTKSESIVGSNIVSRNRRAYNCPSRTLVVRSFATIPSNDDDDDTIIDDDDATTDTDINNGNDESISSSSMRTMMMQHSIEQERSIRAAYFQESSGFRPSSSIISTLLRDDDDDDGDNNDGDSDASKANNAMATLEETLRASLVTRIHQSQLPPSSSQLQQTQNDQQNQQQQQKQQDQQQNQLLQQWQNEWKFRQDASTTAQSKTITRQHERLEAFLQMIQKSEELSKEREMDRLRVWEKESVSVTFEDGGENADGEDGGNSGDGEDGSTVMLVGGRGKRRVDGLRFGMSYNGGGGGGGGSVTQENEFATSVNADAKQEKEKKEQETTTTTTTTPEQQQQQQQQQVTPKKATASTIDASLLKPLQDKATNVEFNPTLLLDNGNDNDSNNHLYLVGVGVRRKAMINLYSVAMYASPSVLKALSEFEKYQRVQAVEALRQEARTFDSHHSGSSSSSSSSMKMTTSFVLEMVFKADAKVISSAIADSVKSRHNDDGNDNENAAAAAEELESLIFQGVMNKGGQATKGTVLQFDCSEKGVSVSVDGAVQGVVQCEGMGSAFVDVFMDENAVSPTLIESCLDTWCGRSLGGLGLVLEENDENVFVLEEVSANDDEEDHDDDVRKDENVDDGQTEEMTEVIANDSDSETLAEIAPDTSVDVDTSALEAEKVERAAAAKAGQEKADEKEKRAAAAKAAQEKADEKAKQKLDAAKKEKEEAKARAEALLKQAEEEARLHEEEARKKEEEARKMAVEKEAQRKKEEELAQQIAREKADAEVAAAQKAALEKAALEAAEKQKKIEAVESLMKPLQDKATKVEFEPKLDEGLYLVGVGVRKKAILNIYSVAMYASPTVLRAISPLQKNQKKDSSAALRNAARSFDPSSPSTSFVLEMVFKADAKTIAGAIAEGVKPRYSGPASDVQGLESLIFEGVKSKGGQATKGTIFRFDCSEEGVAVSVDGNSQGTMKCDGMGSAFVDVFMDDKAVSPMLVENCLETWCGSTL